MVDLSLVYAILEGAGVAGLAALIGYAKSYFTTTPPQAFDPIKFGDTVVIGLVLGGIAGYFGTDVISTQNVLESVGIFAALVYFTDAGVKALWRFLQARFAKAAPSPAT